MFVSRTSSATTTKQRCVIFRSRLYVVTQRCALIHDHRTLVALFFRWRRVARTVWPPSIIRVENKRRRGRSRKVKNIRFENSISTIYQTYPSILPCSLTKEKRQTPFKLFNISIPIDATLRFLASLSHSLSANFLAQLFPSWKICRDALFKRWRRFVRAALYRNFFTG